MKTARLVVIGAAVAALGGCVAVPYDAGYYGEAPGYYAPAPAYYGAPDYGPSIGIGIYGGRVDGYHGRHYRGGHRHDGRRGHHRGNWQR